MLVAAPPTPGMVIPCPESHVSTSFNVPSNGNASSADRVQRLHEPGLGLHAEADRPQGRCPRGGDGRGRRGGERRRRGGGQLRCRPGDALAQDLGKAHDGGTAQASPGAVALVVGRRAGMAVLVGRQLVVGAERLHARDDAVGRGRP